MSRLASFHSLHVPQASDGDQPSHRYGAALPELRKSIHSPIARAVPTRSACAGRAQDRCAAADRVHRLKPSVTSHRCEAMPSGFQAIANLSSTT